MHPEVKKAIGLILLVLVFLLAAGILLTGCRQAAAFDGSRTSGASGFRMEYRILDREETAELMLSEGDQIQVSLSHTSGNVDLTVRQDQEEPVYKGTGQVNAEFILTIPKAGACQISVTGHKARGKVSFTCIPAKDL